MGTLGLESFPWPMLGPTLTVPSSSSAPPKPSGSTASTWCLDRLLRAWMLSRRWRALGLNQGRLLKRSSFPIVARVKRFFYFLPVCSHHQTRDTKVWATEMYAGYLSSINCPFVTD